MAPRPLPLTAVAYYRVSTERQGRSGLGLDAQKTSVRQFLDGGKWRLLAEYTEVESGKINDRPELARALHHAKITGATVVIARLDRLGRNAAFLLSLRDAGVRFHACDLPDLNTMTLGVLATMAQYEREKISERTRLALQAAKARGTRLGGGDAAGLLKKHREWVSMGLKANHAALQAKLDACDRFAQDVAPIVQDVIASLTDAVTGQPPSNRAVARELTARGIRTPSGGERWSDCTLSRIRRRLQGKVAREAK